MRARRLVFVATIVVCATVGGFAFSPATVLAAGVPAIDSETAASVGTVGARLQASVNPEEAATTYRFEYGTDASYGSSVPVADAAIGSGAQDVAVSQAVSGLQAGTTYHYRVVATSSEGTVAGSDKVFRTYATSSVSNDACSNAQVRGAQFSSYLPDCRAYELVSPPDKSGGDVAADPTMTQSTPDGDAIKFTSTLAFGDSVGIEARGEEYVSQRGGEDWSTHAIDPKQPSVAVSLATTAQYQFFSEDLSKGVYYAPSPLTSGHPNVEHANNLYLRSDVLSGLPGSYELLSDAVSPQPPRSTFAPISGIVFAAASADLSHVTFESINDLTPDSSGLSLEAPKLYEWDNGSVRLAGILPNGEPASESVAGQGTNPVGSDRGAGFGYTENTMSSDGSRVIFEGPPLDDESSQGCSEGSHCEQYKGNLYMRIDGATTVQLNASERSTSDPKGPGPARFWGATADDSKVFFTAQEALTDDAKGITEGGYSAENLYMYDFDAPDGKHLTLISTDTNPEAQEAATARGFAMVGMSADGSHVYFLANKALLPGEPSPEGGDGYLYVWHDGTLRFITSHNYFAGFGIDELGSYGRADGNSFRVTPDGGTAIFINVDSATAQQAGYDNYAANDLGEEGQGCLSAINYGHNGRSPCREVYVYKYDTNTLACASCDPSGAAPVSGAAYTNHGYDAVDNYVLTAQMVTNYRNRPLSADGRYVFFDTGDALVQQDSNGWDVYEYDTLTGRVSLITSGTCNCASQFVDAASDGSDVFFTTHQQLVRADIDNSGDLYDARVDGGIASQNQAPAVACSGEECQGPALSAPVFSLPSSSTFAGSGNASGQSKPAAHAKKRSKPHKHKKKKKKKKAKKSGGRVSHRAGR